MGGFAGSELSPFPKAFSQLDYRAYMHVEKSIETAEVLAATRKAHDRATLSTQPSDSLTESLIPRPKYIRPHSEGHASIEGKERQRLEHAYRKEEERLSRDYDGKRDQWWETQRNDHKAEMERAGALLRAHVNLQRD